MSVIYSLHFALTNLVHRGRDEERGATAVEYGLMVALIAAVIIAVVIAIGQNLNTGFGQVCTGVSDAITGGTACPGAPVAP